MDAPRRARHQPAPFRTRGRPVYLLIPRVAFLEGTAYEGCTVWGTGRRNAQRTSPPMACLPLARPALTAQWLRWQLQPFKDASIHVHAVWLDDECLPHPWNGCYEAQRASEACRRAYQPGVLDRFDAFRVWTDNFRAEIFSKGTMPVKQMFPGALVGEYGDVVSGTDSGFGLDALMPSAYANTVDLPRALHDRSLEKSAVDRFYFRNLLEVISQANAKKGSRETQHPLLEPVDAGQPGPQVPGLRHESGPVPRVEPAPTASGLRFTVLIQSRLSRLRRARRSSPWRGVEDAGLSTTSC